MRVFCLPVVALLVFAACGDDAPAISADVPSPVDGGTADTSTPDIEDASIADADADAAPIPTSCVIDGVTHEADAIDPTNECRQCRPALSATAWSSRGAVPIFTGGTAPVTQGWTVISGPPATLTEGEDYLGFATTTTTGAAFSGWQLLYRAGVVPTDRPFALRVELRVEAVNQHNTADSAAALLGSFSPESNHGTQAERASMVYLDADGLGWGDETKSASVRVTDGAYHTVELAVDVDRTATVRFDGTARFTRPGYVTNGTIAVGDQTADARLDSKLRIRSISRVCL